MSESELCEMELAIFRSGIEQWSLQFRFSGTVSLDPPGGVEGRRVADICRETCSSQGVGRCAMAWTHVQTLRPPSRLPPGAQFGTSWQVRHSSLPDPFIRPSGLSIVPFHLSSPIPSQPNIPLLTPPRAASRCVATTWQ